MQEYEFTLGKIEFSHRADSRHWKDKQASNYEILAKKVNLYQQKKLFKDTKTYFLILEGKTFYSNEAIAFKNMDCDDKFCLILNNIEKIDNQIYKSILENRLSEYEN